MASNNSAYNREQISNYLKEIGRITSIYIASYRGEKGFEEAINSLSIPVVSQKTTKVDAENFVNDPYKLAEYLLPNELLEALPFYDELISSVCIDEGGEQRLHILYGLSALWCLMNSNLKDLDQLLSSDSQTQPDDLFNIRRAFRDYVIEPQGPLYDEIRIILPIMLLYHDIGKCLGQQNHPIKGYEILRGNINEFRHLVTGEEDVSVSNAEELSLDIFLSFLRYHDLWGNIATGEAGLPLLSVVLSPIERNPKIHLLQLIIMLVANLSDAYAAYTRRKDAESKYKSDKTAFIGAPKGIDGYTLRRIASQWKKLENALSEDGDIAVSILWEKFIRLARDGAEPIERMHLLIQKANVNGINMADVMNAFKLMPRRVQTTNLFATVRLAYALRFVEAMGKYISQNNEHEDKLPDRICDIISELCAQYDNQIIDNAEQGMVTVLEMSDLRPADYPDDIKSAKPEERFTAMIIDSIFEKSRGIWLSRIIDLVSIRPGR